jgi:MoxR-like ATPase
MEERQVTLGDQTFQLPSPFMVLATQNPIEQEGTYPLPEAQLDRFMFKVLVRYPDKTEELEILRLKKSAPPRLSTIISDETIQSLRTHSESIHVEPKLEEFIVDIVRATRSPADYHLGLDSVIRWGAGPRAVVFFLLACRARALWKSRDFVLPEDVISLAPLILRHRILLTYEALADGQTPDTVIQTILKGVPTP